MTRRISMMRMRMMMVRRRRRRMPRKKVSKNIRVCYTDKKETA